MKEHLHVFIAGTTNSGTGLLRGLLAEHPSISTLMKEGHHYSKVLPRDRGSSAQRMFALYPSKFRWTVKDVFKKDSSKLKEDFYRHWDTSRQVLMEKSPHHMMRAAYMDVVFAPAKFVVIIRNGYAVCEGLRRRKGHDIARCAEQWVKAHEFLFEDLSDIQHCQVRYEMLVTEPQEVVNEILEWLGLEHLEIDLHAPINRQNALGKQFSLTDAPDFDKMSMDHLSGDDIAIIDRIAGELLEQLGYKARITS